MGEINCKTVNVNNNNVCNQEPVFPNKKDLHGRKINQVFFEIY